MLHLVKNGTVVMTVLEGRAVDYDGIHISPATVNAMPAVYEGNTYTLVQAPPEPEPPTPEGLRAQMPKLAKWRVFAAINLVPGLREKIDAAIERMPEPAKTINRSKFDNVVELDRLDPLFDLIGGDEEIGFSRDDIDLMWMQAAQF